MANKFKAGDTVQLNAGSNIMTVKGHAMTYANGDKIVIADKYECAWNHGAKPQKAVFSEDAIKLVKKFE